MSTKWYIDTIRNTEPELLDCSSTELIDWIDDKFLMYAEDADTAAHMDDAIREQEAYFGIDVDYMSRAQLLTVAAKIIQTAVKPLASAIGI